jgi:hypothetical protein
MFVAMKTTALGVGLDKWEWYWVFYPAAQMVKKKPLFDP